MGLQTVPLLQHHWKAKHQQKANACMDTRLVLSSGYVNCSTVAFTGFVHPPPNSRYYFQPGAYLLAPGPRALRTLLMMELGKL